MRRLASLIISTVSVLALGGCPGSLSNPEDFIGGGGAPAPKSVYTVFEEGCGKAGCHSATAPQAGLDLVTNITGDTVEDRVVGMPATGEGCQTETLVVAGDPDGSYLLEKVRSTAAICGLPMPPLEEDLDPGDADIIEQWIIDLGMNGEIDGGV